MGRILKDLWTIITISVKEMDDPNQRVLWMLGVVVTFFIIVLSLSALCFGFVENLIEIIGNTITTTAIGEFPEVAEKQYLYYMRTRAGFVEVIEAVDEYSTFVTNINDTILVQYQLGIGVKDIKYTVTEARGAIYYSALLVFDDQRMPEPDPEP